MRNLITLRSVKYGLPDAYEAVLIAIADEQGQTVWAMGSYYSNSWHYYVPHRIHKRLESSGPMPYENNVLEVGYDGDVTHWAHLPKSLDKTMIAEGLSIVMESSAEEPS